MFGFRDYLRKHVNKNPSMHTKPISQKPHTLPPPIPRPKRSSFLSKELCALAGAAAIGLGLHSAQAATITYDFNNGTLQGWHNRVWDTSANGGSGGWVDLAPNVTAMPGTINGGSIEPASSDNNLFGNNGTQIDPVGGSTDNHLNTLWLRSPQFAPDGSGDLTVQMARGKAHGAVPVDEASVSYVADASTGWKGVLLRNVSTGAFVLAKPRTSEGDAMVTVTFTAAELAPFVGVTCTLELINSERGSWGWLSMDNVSIPGTLRQSKLEVAAPSVTVGGTTTATVTIPSDFNATKAITAYLTNGNPGKVTLNGSAASVLAVTFAAGAAPSQAVTIAGTAFGYTPLNLGCVGLESAAAGVAVVPRTGLIGRWLAGPEDLNDKSGYAPAGTHDGALPEGFTAAFSPDVPPVATSGSSLDLATSSGAVVISNTVITDPGYLPTFDDATAKQLSVTFWARGVPSSWNPFVSKWGEGSTGWQVRRRGDSPVATFTIRSTSAEDDPFNGSTFIDDGAWHHFAATWDGVSGIRKLYVDGKLDVMLAHDNGPMGLANANYLSLGGRAGTGSSTPGNTLAGQLFDVRIYGTALSGSTVQGIFTANTSSVLAYAEDATIDQGRTGVVSVSIPETANATAAVTVYVTNTTPALVSLPGAVNNVVALTFPAGGATSQSITVTGLAEGEAQLACAATGLTSSSVTMKVYGKHMIGRWFNGTENFNDSSSFTPAGTHDGVELGGTVTFSTDVPPSKSGKSGMFSGAGGLMIANSSLLDSGYAPTFDGLISRQFTVGFWAKGIPGTWNPFVSKRGDDAIGWQVRRSSDVTEAFTIRGSGSSNADGVGSVAIDDGKWHHFAAVWDGYTGTRKCYVDGVLDPSVDITGDFAPMAMAPNKHLILGAREPAAVTYSPTVEGPYNGLLYDVRMYNYPLTAAEVKDLSFIAAIKVIPVQRSLEAPKTMAVDIVLPDGALQSQAITVQVRNDSPTIASLVGASGNITTLTYPVGGSLTQQVTVAGIKDGFAKVSATGGGFSEGSATFSVWADPGTKLIGHWISGEADLVDRSGFRPAGTHNGFAVGDNADYLTFSPELPPGYTSGQSLDLSFGNVGVMITNTATVDGSYVETFDNQMQNKFTIAFWAKGTPASAWNPWISKRGEGDAGYQVRRYSDADPIRPTFTIRGTAGDDDPSIATTVDNDNWHHYAATWDGTTGSRTLYLDGKSVLSLSGDTGPMGLATPNHLMLGGRDNGGYGNYFAGLLFDVRIYSYALDTLEVSALANPPTTFSLSLSPLIVPENEIMQLAITVPVTATANSPLTVYLTNNSPTVVQIVGSTGNVFPVTFPVGTAVMGVDLLTLAPGQINITAGAAGQGSAQLSTVNTVVARKLIGHWFDGTADLTDKSGFTPAGTHDAVVVGANPETLAYSDDVPAGFTGKSVDLSANATGTVGISVDNSATTDVGYLPTFDDGISATFSVTVWAKGVPGTWNGFVSKRGEDGIGWQIRRSGGDTEAFTIRGSASGNYDGVGSINITDGSKWHHFAAVWDGVAGTRKCYVDGVLDPKVDLTGDFAPMSMAPNHHVAIGARETAGTGGFDGWFTGKLYDVRIYNYPISAEEVAALAGLAGEPPTLTITRVTNRLRISWPTSFTGYALQQATSLTGTWTASSLTVTTEGDENVVYVSDPVNSLFFRLKK
jgi:hypothetical protein